jgi:uncharacterized damage-inducible protein DinB
MSSRASSDRGEALATRLEDASARLIGVIETIEDGMWRRTPRPDVWSVSKDVEHVIEASGYHQWIIRLTIGDEVPKRKPVLERKRMASEMPRSQAIDELRRRTDEGAALLRRLTDDQLDLVTQPPRARGQRLAETIDQVLIDHHDGHLADIEAKLRA